MELNFKLTYNIPEELIKALGINEDTLFCTSYEDGTLCVEAVNEEDSPCYDCPYYCPECGSCTKTEDDCDE